MSILLLLWSGTIPVMGSDFCIFCGGCSSVCSLAVMAKTSVALKCCGYQHRSFFAVFQPGPFLALCNKSSGRLAKHHFWLLQGFVRSGVHLLLPLARVLGYSCPRPHWEGSHTAIGPYRCNFQAKACLNCFLSLEMPNYSPSVRGLGGGRSEESTTCFKR